MEQYRSQRISEAKREKFKKKNAQEKKTRSDTTTISSESSITDSSLDSILVVGKSCGYGKFKPHESGYRLHECFSETAINPQLSSSQNIRDAIRCEGLLPIPSNSSFQSAKSDLNEVFQSQISDLEEKLCKKNLVIQNLKKQLGNMQVLEFNSVATETEESINIEEHMARLKDLEQKLTFKDKKIKELNLKLEECLKFSKAQKKENCDLTNRINLQNRQLQSMYELLREQKWSSIDPAEFAKCKTKTAELESSVGRLQEENTRLSQKIKNLIKELENKERELSATARELVEYKNRSTLEMCKLINQIDSLQKEAKAQSQVLDSKILEAQACMEEEIVTITHKLEDQYQKDVKSAIEKFHADFQRLANLPKTAIEQLLKFCEPGKMDFLSYQREWDQQQAVLEAKVATMQTDHDKEIGQLKDNYESKIMFLKTQVEALSSQLKERKDIIDIFENELMVYKSNSSINLLKASTLGDDISALKELYTAEIFSQKQVHKLQLDIFEEKVKTLTEEILFHAKTEEIQLEELDRARKMAMAFREKYELLVYEWEEKVEKDFKANTQAEASTELDVIIEEFRSLMDALKHSEQAREDRIKMLETKNNDEKLSFQQNVEELKSKLQELTRFQKAQTELDQTIHGLVGHVGMSYSKTVEALLMSHVMEVSLKQLEMCASEKRHIEEIDGLKNDHEKEVQELQSRAEKSKHGNSISDDKSTRKVEGFQEIKTLEREAQEISVECLKSEALLAAKEETEKALGDRIRELENILKTKEESCRKELEDLMAKYIKSEILSSSKDDLAKELEDKLKRSETLLEKAFEEIDRLTEICPLLEPDTGPLHQEDGGDCRSPRDLSEKFEEAQKIGERLKMKLVKTFERWEEMREPIQKEMGALREEKKEILKENNKMKKEISGLLEEVEKKNKLMGKMKRQSEELAKMSELRKKVEELEKEKNEILERERSSEKEKEDILERNEFLEGKILILNERIDELTREMAENEYQEEGEAFSISLRQIRFLYQEEQEVEATNYPSDPDESLRDMNLWKTNEMLQMENEALRVKLREREEPKTGFLEEVILELKNTQKELSDAIKERDELMSIAECLGRERNRLKEELAVLREENQFLRSKCEIRAEMERTGSDHSGVAAVNEEIRKLTDYIKKLSKKLELMKANNELLLSESREHLKQNQNLVSELEEAWSQRYEIEDQLAKVRKENALLNLHRRQLEETNKRISGLVSEGKPSVVSWVKIHETVENIVDEVLALKTSFSDSGSSSGASTGLNVSKTNSELKLMTEALHAQLRNKTALCDELIVQKETLEGELENLEAVLQKHEPQLKNLKTVEVPGSDGRQPETQTEERDLSLQETSKASESTHLITLNKLKKHLADQASLKEAQFRKNLELEVRELKKEMRKLEEGPGGERRESGDEDGDCLKSVESRYEEEVGELTKEFEREVERLKEAFGSEELGESYEKEIEKLKEYFEKKWADLEKRYTEIYEAQKQKRRSSDLELNRIVEKFYGLISEEGEAPEKKSKLENLLKEVMSRRDEEVKFLGEKYKEAVSLLESKHDSEVKKLQSVVVELRENIMTALKKECGAQERGGDGQEEDLVVRIRAEYEEELEEEKKKFSERLEEERRNHEKEILALEEFWTEKLSECETKCALMKAAGGRRSKRCRPGESDIIEMDEGPTEGNTGEEENRVVECEGVEEFCSDQVTGVRTGEEDSLGGLCVSRFTNRSLYKRMEVKTDDDKLDVMQQRDAIEELLSSMRGIALKLLTLMGPGKPDPNNTTLDFDDTLYRSLHVDFDRTIVSETSMVSTGAKDLSAIFQEIKDCSLLGSSDHVRVELERCLKQLKKDATCLLALSSPEHPGQNFTELIKKVEKEKQELEEKVLRVEEIQKEMKKEINTTKERLSQWERNLEVVSEGYGEEVVGPKQIISLSDLKEKLKAYLTENCGHSPQDLNINLLEEICKEGDRLQEEWMKEKCDLQQQGWGSKAKRGGQMDVADKQVHSLKKFLEEQAVEREQEREAFDREISSLRESLKARERDNSLQMRTNQEVEALSGQVKELTTRLTEAEKNKGVVEGEFQNAVKKIWSLREVIQELESQLAEVSERENNLKKKVEKLEGAMEEQGKIQKGLREELEICRAQSELKYSDHIKSLEDELVRLRHVADQVNPESLTHLKESLRQMEAILIKKTKDLEQVHVSSANVSCSSPSEDVSIRDHLDATRCSTPDEMAARDHLPLCGGLPSADIDRVMEKLARHTRAEEVAVKHIQDLKMRLRNHRKALEEVQTERDVLLEKVDAYLKENSSLKVRLEEQRCNAGLLQKQLNANLESQINRLEVDVEKLNGMCDEKDKQLRELKMILENTTRSLKARETEALNKSKEENAFITTLKTDLANALNEKETLEEALEKTREKLRESLKMPALIDSMIEEKNAEIDRLEKEVARLSSSRNLSGEERQKRKIRFSEPESFSENISSISGQCLSEMRNCSDSYADFRNSSFKTRRPVGSSTKLESISSIAPLQLSPRGGDSSFGWKTSSPIFPARGSPAKSALAEEKEEEEVVSKLEEEVESKRSEISELHLEMDILKRQLVEANQEVATARSRVKEMQSELAEREEEVRLLKNRESSLLLSIESGKKKHEEEVEELENKLRFERGKVETVYEEIKSLEVKKIEIEEAFLSLREDYNEKINGEKKTAEGLVERIRNLEARNGEAELKVEALGRELESAMKESENTIQALSKEVAELRSENERIREGVREKADAETQVEGEGCVCQGGLTLEVPKTEGSAAPLKENLDELKTQFEKMAAAIGERDFNKKDAFLYAVTVRELLGVVLKRVEELTKEVEARVKKVMECSVDDLAVKVQRELVLSAKLDNQLLSSIEATGFVRKEGTPQPDVLEVGCGTRDVGGGDGGRSPPGKRREDLEAKVSEQEKVIHLLEDSLRREKERILEEKDRCSEDAKIMELLRVNLEKRLLDLKTKSRELRKERQTRMALEKEVEDLKKQGVKDWESKKVAELSARLESQKEKVLSVGQLLEEEKKKNQELRLSLEEERIERISEKNAQRLVESDLNLVREQKEKLKVELLSARELLHSRSVEIGLLKRKINLQEVVVKALTVSSGGDGGGSSLGSAAGDSDDFPFVPSPPTPLQMKIKMLNSCIRRHVRESSEMGEALLYLSQGTEQMKDIIRQLEENGEGKVADETLVADAEIERKLWALEKGKLAMDLETVKRENEVLKRDLVDTSKSNELLKMENSRLKKGGKSPRKESGMDLVENGFLQERVSHLTRKYMRSESYRKALAWQKHYLLITLQEYQRSEEKAWRKIGKRKEGKKKGAKPCGRFRVVALAVASIFRMKFIVRRWQRSLQSHALSLLEAQTRKLDPLSSVLNIYSDPVNPLSYQTQNIFRQPSSQVLRTPPSRDPGPESFPSNFHGEAEGSEHRHVMVATLKGLP